MERRDFLKKSGTGLLAVTLLGKNAYAFVTEDAGPESCIPTTADILGPFYRANAPFRSDLTVIGDPGTALVYKGTVIDAACNPISNALVDVWQANDAGAYDNATPQFHYRGRQYTDGGGNYAFISIKAGAYLNGSQYRPSHIHFRVTAPGFTELITQLYFVGDPYIPADPWASHPSAQLRIVPVNQVNGVDTAEFHITLSSPTSLSGESYQSPVIMTNPVSQNVHLQIHDGQLTDIEIFSASGHLNTVAYEIHSSSYTLPVDMLPPGIYFCRINTTRGIFVHKMVKQ